MTLITLLDYLIHNKLKHDFITGDGTVLHDVVLTSYKLDGPCCLISTEQGHKVKVDLSKFKKIIFDETPFEPTNQLKMENYLSKLEEYIPYNAYLETPNNLFIAGFYDIGKAL